MFTIIFFIVFLSTASTLPQLPNNNQSSSINDTIIEIDQNVANEQAQNNNSQGLHQVNASEKLRPDGNITIIKSQFIDKGDGNFHWAFETSDGFRAEQMGVPGKSRQPKPRTYMAGNTNETENGDSDVEEEGGEEIIGSYSYRAPNGQNISVTYTAGVDGFRPKGTHIPTLPPNFGSRKSEKVQVKPSSPTQNTSSRDETTSVTVPLSTDSFITSQPPREEQVTTF